MSISHAPSGLFTDIGKAPQGRRERALREAARIAIEESLKVQPGEKVLIITNPQFDVRVISEALYDATARVGGVPTLLFQSIKTQMQYADDAVLAAFAAEPEVVISMSAQKLGKDRNAGTTPYSLEGKNYDHIFHYQMYGKKTCRSFWSPSVTLDSFLRTVPIDYPTLKRRSAAIKAILDRAVAARITAPSGTDLTIGLRGRSAFCDDGNFSTGGSGGNLPAGETFISPENGTACGTIAFDGSISLHDGEILIRKPIVCTLEEGFITRIEGGAEAERLLGSVTLAEKNAKEFEASGKLPKGMGDIYARNASAIGELGIGLNPKARISGNMLEDEKAFRTCHFAVGHNYDEDAPALIHLDGLVKQPTIMAIMEDGSEICIERDGELAPEIR